MLGLGELVEPANRPKFEADLTCLPQCFVVLVAAPAVEQCAGEQRPGAQ